jgi:hypothetical protein
MKAFIKKIITSGYGLIDYVPVGIDQIQEKSLLQLGDNSPIEITEQQFTLAYNPLVIGIVMSRNLYKILHSEQGAIKLFFVDTRTNRKISELNLKYYKIPDGWNMDQEILVLFHAQRANNYQLNRVRRNIILWLRYWSNKKAKKYFGTLSFGLHKQYAAQFSFPRKVVLAAVKDGDFFHLFPIDLHGMSYAQNIYSWGIRHSNKAIPHLKNSKKIVIADVPYTSFQAIYSLGNFRASNIDGDKVSAEIVSRTWQYILPDFVLGYKEIELVHDENIGSQCLFWGRIIHAETTNRGKALHHVHLLRFLQLQREEENGYSTNS